MRTNDIRRNQVPQPDPHGVVVLDRARRVISANRFAREQIENGDAIHLTCSASRGYGKHPENDLLDREMRAHRFSYKLGLKNSRPFFRLLFLLPRLY